MDYACCGTPGIRVVRDLICTTFSPLSLIPCSELTCDERVVVLRVGSLVAEFGDETERLWIAEG